ncbi:LacI family DNA-binding transcriptional regulator [Lysinibacillus agricola]|uniref:LacI family DNA-binding transcriptional regulator n=1 Tax=Lysinibacillus agricola TaxID=2590012 RepID=A0ABX7AU57_9BACI|nr:MULTISPECIES: LacI family DNA-binding transcriptional regulator [Lysinibacillus]KOS60563.1 transcriptional regulator [Lysinibacillus sp. FJAT-14222]QQP12812.1 LacI family DNA-binding transcriptional regulator [Lysinibacillus agricola]
MVSSKDVAKYAGVSQTTVSRVLNTPHLVKKPTLDKVMKAIDELNYIPNAHARSLVQNKTGTIVLLSGPLHNPFFVDTTTAIVNYANDMGYRVNVQFVNDKNLSEAYATAIEHKVDGIVLSCILIDDPFFEQLKRMNIPFITYNRKHKNNEYFVEIDNFEAGYLAAKHIIELGHKQLAWVGGPLTVSTFNNRFLGFMQALQDAKIEIKDSYIFNTDTSKVSISQAFQTLTETPHPPTAICAGADSLALNLLDDAMRSNISIPNELSIIGIDNVELSQHGAIQLTTVGSISEQNLGFLAIKKLIEMIENKKNSCVKITESVKVFDRSTTRKI